MRIWPVECGGRRLWISWPYTRVDLEQRVNEELKAPLRASGGVVTPRSKRCGG